MSRNGEGLWGTLGAIGLAAWMGWEFIRTYKKENKLYEEYEKQQTMKKEEENKKNESTTEASAPVIVPDEVEDYGDYMEWRRKHHPTWIDKADEAGERFMDSGGIYPMLAIATGNDKAVGQMLNTVTKNAGERALVRERGEQQRLTYSNKAKEDRATHTSKTEDEIRKKAAEEMIRQQGKRFDEIDLIKEKIKAGLYTPPSAAQGTPPLAADAPAEPPRRIVYSDLGDIASNPENRVRPILGNWLKQREITFIVGGSKSNKTTLGVQMAIDLCDGEYSELFDCEVLKQRVVYLSYELRPEQWGERYYNAGDLLKKKGVNIILKEQLKNYGAFSVEGTLKLCHDICDGEMEQGTKRLTIFIDNFTLIAKNPGNPTAKECKALYEGLEKLIEECVGLALTIVVVGHTDKDGKKLRGSSVMVDLVDSVIHISPFEGLKEVKVRDIVMKVNRSLSDPEGIQGRVTDEPYLHLEPFDLLEYIIRSRQISEEEALEEERRMKEQVKEAVDKLHDEWKRQAQEEWKKEAEEAQVVPPMELPATEQSPQPDSASTEGEDSDDEPKSWSREKIELTDELLARCREVYDEAISSGKGKTAALKEAARKVLGDEGKYKTVERRLSL